MLVSVLVRQRQTNFYRPPKKLREGNVFTDMCLFTGGRVSLVPYPFVGGRVSGGMVSRGYGIWGRISRGELHMLSPDTLPHPSPRTTKVGGVHPTGMLSGYYLNLGQLEKLSRKMHVITYKRQVSVSPRRGRGGKVPM